MSTNENCDRAIRILNWRIFMVSFIYFFLLPILLFFLDICLSGIFLQQYLHLLFIFLLVSLPFAHSWYHVTIPFILLAIESTIQTGMVGWSFFISLGCYALAHFFHNHAKSPQAASTATLTIFLILTLMPALFTPFLAPSFYLYTSLKFAGNLGLLNFSLKWLSAVARDNRS